MFGRVTASNISIDSFSDVSAVSPIQIDRLYLVMLVSPVQIDGLLIRTSKKN